MNLIKEVKGVIIMTTNIKSPQELYDEYSDVELLQDKELYKRSNAKYEKSNLSDFEQFLDNNCPFLIKNGTCKNKLDSNMPLALRSTIEIRLFINKHFFTLDLPEDKNKYVSYSIDTSNKNERTACLNSKYKTLLEKANWKIKYIGEYYDDSNWSDSINIHPTYKVYAQFKLIPIGKISE